MIESSRNIAKTPDKGPKFPLLARSVTTDEVYLFESPSSATIVQTNSPYGLGSKSCTLIPVTDPNWSILPPGSKVTLEVKPD